MTTNRRDFIVGTGAAIAAANLPTVAVGADADADVQKLLAAFAEELLADYPESATALGIDNGRRAALKAKLSDRSAAGQQSIARRVAARLQRLEAIDTGSLTAATQIDVDVMRTAHEFAAEGFAFPYGDTALLNTSWSWRNAPYVVAQNTGAFLEIPGMLDEQHTIVTREDADAYLARLESYAAQLKGETGRLHSAAAQGVIAPDFVLDKTLRQLKIARGGRVTDWALVSSLAKRTKSLSGDYATKAEKIATASIAPALDRQIAELETHRRKARPDAGVWKLPQGEAYYAWTLAAATTTRMTPDQIHARGQEELSALQSEMDAILKREGLTQGTVGERMTALGRDARFRFEDSDAGRARLMQFLEQRVSDMRARLPRAFATLVPGHLEIKRMPPEVEPGAPGAYGGAGTIDGKVPGKFWINLHEMNVWTTYNLPTLTYHESIPGHVWQGEYTFRLPLFRSLLAFNAYSEGWALYAEQLANELGVYDDDPYGRLGYLQSIAFRACRLVIDTGLHAKRWTREQAIQWFASTNGSSVEEVTSEVDRYCAWPGQACGYKVGHSEINRLRRQAQQALGSRFDLRQFNDALVKGGGVPMVTLARMIDSFVAQVR
ncbi:MAG TPA: DUF885 family protein [Povalibacter sp.]|uniref:DUF885 domain-containing protein n=1 Tax=Povalibacter sp. TaxID=1962978 RepID=UPI002C746F64|nr:DUF885 family protein [Povalibacter sp.]HMN44938.1 DUF885 family protein [Povalibacter sp.]